jgi:hypothetical protein
VEDPEEECEVAMPFSWADSGKLGTIGRVGRISQQSPHSEKTNKRRLGALHAWTSSSESGVALTDQETSLVIVLIRLLPLVKN